MNILLALLILFVLVSSVTAMYADVIDRLRELELDELWSDE